MNLNAFWDYDDDDVDVDADDDDDDVDDEREDDDEDAVGELECILRRDWKCNWKYTPAHPKVKRMNLN